MKAGEILGFEGKEYLVVGKTFGSKVRLEKGDVLALEGEQLNLERDEDGQLLALTVWAPEVMGKAEGKPDSLGAIIARARRHGVLREKVRHSDGTVEYLPNEAGEPGTAYKAVEYPDEDKHYSFVFQLHFRGRSVHGDLRVSKGDVLAGWTVAMQQPEAIKEPVETLEDARKTAADPDLWKMDLKTGLVKERQIRGGVVRRGDLRAFPKATEIPKDWISVEGVTDRTEPGERPPVGATRQYPGVFLIVEKGEAEWGAMKPYFTEIFLHGDKWGNQRWTFRLVGREEKDEAEKQADVLPPGVEEAQARSDVYWILLQPKDQTPYTLDKDAIEKDWLPPKGVSCLPRAIRKNVPKELRYWEVEGKEALERRAKLAEMDLRELGGPETGEKAEGRWVTIRGKPVFIEGASERLYPTRSEAVEASGTKLAQATAKDGRERAVRMTADDDETLLSETARGTKRSVEMPEATNDEVGTIHSHPLFPGAVDAMPPSPEDFAVHSERAARSGRENYETYIVALDAEGNAVTYRIRGQPNFTPIDANRKRMVKDFYEVMKVSALAEGIGPRTEPKRMHDFVVETLKGLADAKGLQFEVVT